MKRLSLLLLIPLLAQCGYIRPRAGAAIPVDGGDTSYSLGITAGVPILPFFNAEASYERLFATGSSRDANLFRGEGVLFYPEPDLSPYVSAGAGFIWIEDPDATDPIYTLGGGVTSQYLNPLTVGIGVSYIIVQGRGDLVQPLLTLGLSF